MKKITLLCSLVLATISFCYSQNFKIYKYGDHNNLVDSTFNYYGDPSSSMSTVALNVINLGASIDTIKVTRIYVSVLGYTTNAICWAGKCWDSTHNVSDLYTIIGPGDTAQLANTFTGDYWPTGRIGTSTFKYVFYDIGKPTVSDTITVNYISKPAGVAQLSGGQINFSALYPNPANTSVNFNYSLSNTVQSATLKVFNLLGECVQTLPLSASKSKTTLDVQYMPSGIYVCEIEANGSQPAYQKLVVSH